MTLDQLRYFYEAARFQHVGKAAKFVHISPSAISAAISSLESELECRLFDRVGKSILLTDTGSRLKDEAEKLLDRVSGFKSMLRGGVEQLRGHYRLGASPFLAAHILTRAWSKLQNENPELNGEISSLPTALALRELLTGALDFALCFSPFQHPELRQIEIYRGRLVVAVRPGHPLLKTTGKRAVMGLSEFPAVLHKGLPGVDLCEAHPIFARYGITPKIRLAFDNDACAIERVTSSDSWALIPDVVAKAHSKEVKSLSHPTDWDASYFVALAYRTGRERIPVVQAVRSELQRLL